MRAVHDGAQIEGTCVEARRVTWATEGGVRLGSCSSGPMLHVLLKLGPHLNASVPC